MLSISPSLDCKSFNCPNRLLKYSSCFVSILFCESTNSVISSSSDSPSPLFSSDSPSSLSFSTSGSFSTSNGSPPAGAAGAVLLAAHHQPAVAVRFPDVFGHRVGRLWAGQLQLQHRRAGAEPAHRPDGSLFFWRDTAGDEANVIEIHSGMFPCFLGGRLARFPRRARIALITATRVAAGSMMPSSSPRSAAKNGLATL